MRESRLQCFAAILRYEREDERTVHPMGMTAAVVVRIVTVKFRLAGKRRLTANRLERCMRY